jgi:hypothetical protein
MRLNRRSPHASGAGKLQTRKNEITASRVRSTKTAAFQQSAVTLDRVAAFCFTRETLITLLNSPASGMVNQASSYKLIDAPNSNTIERFLQHTAGNQKNRTDVAGLRRSFRFNT